MGALCVGVPECTASGVTKLATPRAAVSSEREDDGRLPLPLPLTVRRADMGRLIPVDVEYVRVAAVVAVLVMSEFPSLPPLELVYCCWTRCPEKPLGTPNAGRLYFGVLEVPAEVPALVPLPALSPFDIPPELPMLPPLLSLSLTSFVRVAEVITRLWVRKSRVLFVYALVFFHTCVGPLLYLVSSLAESIAFEASRAASSRGGGRGSCTSLRPPASPALLSPVVDVDGFVAWFMDSCVVDDDEIRALRCAETAVRGLCLCTSPDKDDTGAAIVLDFGAAGAWGAGAGAPCW